MIQVRYHKEYNRLTMEGHACSGEKGHDLVCSAASTLAYTLAANVGRLQESGLVRDADISLTEGKAEIGCNPVHRYRAVTQLVFDTVCTGFSLLASDYPENITFEIFQK